MKKAIYIHGLGGSGTGSSSQNVRKLIADQYSLDAFTYDLLDPATAFANIQQDVKGYDLIIASSLGGFCASALNNETPCILLNPCMKPQEAIEPILWPEQQKLFNKEKCLSEWNAISAGWSKMSDAVKKSKFGVFADEDEFFHYKDFFDSLFKNEEKPNSCMINGVHEIAKFPDQLCQALKNGFDYF